MSWSAYYGGYIMHWILWIYLKLVCITPFRKIKQFEIAGTFEDIR